MAELRDAFNEVSKALDDELARLVAAQNRPDRALTPAQQKKANREAVTLFLRTVRFEVHVKGQHYSGLSNEALFDVRSREGRDFLVRTVQMDQHIRRRMLEGFEGFATTPTRAQLEKEHERLVLQWIVVERFAKGGGDIDMPELTPRYAAKKRKAGKGSRPIGEWSGRHKKAVINHGFVKYL